jgi:hypothetical protein
VTAFLTIYHPMEDATQTYTQSVKSIPMKKPINTKYFQTKIIAGLYEYRGYDIWKDATRNKWVINGPSGGLFNKLVEAKSHVDRIIKYPSLRTKKKPHSVNDK